MADPIDFQAEKDKRNIDEQYRLVMPDGSKWYKFFADYEFQSDGVGLPEDLLKSLDRPGVTFFRNRFSFEFWARDKDDAEKRLEAMKTSGALVGQMLNDYPT